MSWETRGGDTPPAASLQGRNSGPVGKKMPGGYCYLLHWEQFVKGAYHCVVSGRRHEAGRQGWSLPSSRSQSGMRAGDDVRRDGGATARGRAPRMESGMRAGDDVRRDDRATARGRAPGMEYPLLSPPVRDASRRRRPTARRHEAGRQSVFSPPPLAPSQVCEQGTKMAVPRRYDGDEQTRSTLGRADPEQGPP